MLSWLWRSPCACSPDAISKNGTSQRPHAFLIEEPLSPHEGHQPIQEAYSEFQIHAGKPDPVGLSHRFGDTLAGQPGLPGNNFYARTGNGSPACSFSDRQGKRHARCHSLGHASSDRRNQTVQSGNRGATGGRTFPAIDRELRPGATDLCRDQQKQTGCCGRRRSKIPDGAVLLAR